MSQRSAWVRFWTPGRLLFIFTLVNMVNYIDRYVIAGMTKELGHFVQYDMPGTTKPDTWIGATQSAFIGGYAAASLVFGHLVHKFHPFRLMSVGLLCWCASVVLTGLAPHVWVMIAARVISGVGEASFQCIVPPYIDDHAPPAKRGLWLAIFFMAIPVGSAIGFGYGAAMAGIGGEAASCADDASGSGSAGDAMDAMFAHNASTSGSGVGAPCDGGSGWRIAYLAEAVVMFPMALLVFYLPYGGKKHRGHSEASDDLSDVGDMGHVMPSDKLGDGRGRSVSYDVPPPTVIDELRNVVSSKMFLSTSLGYAAYTFVTSGIATWGAKFLLSLGLFEKELTASLVFGGIVSVTGALGTPIGGFLLDGDQRKEQATRLEMLAAAGVATPDEDDDETGDTIDKLCAASRQLFFYSFVGGALCVVAAVFVKAVPAIFFIGISLGCIMLFATTSATNLNVMSAVPPENRSFAIGVNTILIHALGDVPSPPIIGYLMDTFNAHLVLVLLTLYLGWTVFFWGACLVMARLKRRQYVTAMSSSLLAQRADA
mmetsp:Transcript_7977/g.28461  ORF Transcript_7977/g.28461 Transcript_7977/m.28461 type:complete len:541 (-) Transcript_7977:64-1686(-)